MADFDAKIMISRIERVLAEKGMSKEEFYAKSGISSASFSQWNTGVHKPTLKKVFSAAEALCVDPDYLLGRIDTAKPELKEKSKKIVIRIPKLTEYEKKEYREWDEEETYKAAKQLVDSYEKEKSPTGKIGEADLDDPYLIQLFEIAKQADEAGKKFLIATAKNYIESRKEK